MQLIRGSGSFFFEGSKVGCLLIHGWSATPQQIRPLGDQLARQGLTVLGLRLPGHGTSVDDLERYTLEDWIASVNGGVDQLMASCSALFIMGSSLGGALALYTGARRGQELTGVVAINAPVIGAPGLEEVLDNPATPARFSPPFDPRAEILDPRGAILRYPQGSKSSLSQAFRILEPLRAALGSLTVPLLIFSSRQDKVLPPENGRYLFDHVGSTDKTLIELTDSAHVATHDYDSERIGVECLTFIHQHT